MRPNVALRVAFLLVWSIVAGAGVDWNTAVLLWPKGAPQAKGDARRDKPALIVSLPDKDHATGTAVVVNPGGAYFALAAIHEGVQVAEWLNSIGIAAFVLCYRLTPDYEPAVALLDAQRAIRYVRGHADEYGIDPNRIGMMGFSAGGHLASAAGTQFTTGDPNAEDPVERASSRPDFLCLVYPATAPELLRPSQFHDILPTYKLVTPHTPPTFLVHTHEDEMLSPNHSILFYQALLNAHVQSEIHIFGHGKHGLGLAPDDPELGQWPTLFTRWLRRSGFLILPVVLSTLSVALPAEETPPEQVDVIALPQELVGAFRAFNSDISDFFLHARRPINPEFDVLLLCGAVPDRKRPFPQNEQAQRKRYAMGVFVVRSASYQPYLTLDPPGRLDVYGLRTCIQDVGDDHLILSQYGDCYGQPAGQTKYFYDLARNKLLNQLHYFPMDVYEVISARGMVACLGSDDRDQSVVLWLRPPITAGDASCCTIVEAIEGKPIPRLMSARTDQQSLILYSERQQYTWSGESWKTEGNPNFRLFVPRSGSNDEIGLSMPFLKFWRPLNEVKRNVLRTDSSEHPGRSFLVWNEAISETSSGGEKSPGIYEIEAGRHVFHPLPQPSAELFRSLRPDAIERAGSGYDYTIRNDIGAFRRVGNDIVFGTTFYDGEGMSGIGAIGRFDTETEQYELDYAPQLARWSTAALAPDSECLWLGLASRPEGHLRSGGLARYDLTGKTLHIYPIPKVINVIYKLDDTLYVGTEDGIYLVRHDRVTTRLTATRDIRGNRVPVIDTLDLAPAPR